MLHKVGTKVHLPKYQSIRSQPTLFSSSVFSPIMISNETEKLISPSPPPPSPPKPEPHKTPSSPLLLQPLKWLQTLSSSLHPTLILGIIIFGLNVGFTQACFRVVTDYYWKDIQQIHPSTAQYYVAFYYIPWILRPLWGLLSDIFPIMGYHRRPYLVAAGIIGVFSAVTVTVVSDLPASLALVCFIGIVCGLAIATATIDASIAKHSIEVKELAADLQSLRGYGLSFGGLLGFFSSGFLVHALGPQVALGLMAIAPSSFLVLGFVIYEPRVSKSTQNSKKVVQRIGGAMENMYKTMKFPQVWKPSIFMFLSLALSYSTHEGHFYWYTDRNAGPGFSKEFIGMMYAIGAIGSIIGVFLYQRFLKDFPLRSLLFYAQVLYATSGMFDLMFILRWNLSLGIPDSLFIIVEEAVLHIISYIRWMPMVVLSTRLCPLGIEGTFFAFLMCIDSLGSLSSKMIGGMVLNLFNISRTNFSNLWLALLVRNCLRFGTLTLIFLVPNATQNDVLVPSEIITSSQYSTSEVEDSTLELVPLTENFDN